MVDHQLVVEGGEADANVTIERLGNRSFFGLQCVLYPPSGRARVARLLNGTRSEMQLDAALGLLSNLKRLDLLLVSHGGGRKPAAVQKPGRATTLQTICELCNTEAGPGSPGDW